MSALDLANFTGIMDYLDAHNLFGYDGLILSGLAELVPKAYLRGLLLILFFLFMVMFFMEWSRNNFQDIRRDYLLIGYLSTLLVLGNDWIWLASAYHLGILALDLFTAFRQGVIAPKHFVNIIIIWLGAWFLFGDVSVLLYMLPLAVGGILLLQQFITTMRYGTHKEKSYIKKEGFGGEYRKQRRLEIAAENMAGKEHSNAKKKGVRGTEAGIGEETAQLIADAEATEIHEEAATASAKAIADAITSFEEAELKIRQDEDHAEEKIENLIISLQSRLSHASPEQVQQIGSEVLKRLGRALDSVVDRMVHDENYETHITQKTLNEIKEASSVFGQAVDHVEMIQNESLSVLKKLESLEMKHIDTLVKEITTKEKQLKELSHKIKHAKDEQTKQILNKELQQVKQQKGMLDKERTKLEPYKDYLKKILEKHRRALLRVKDDAQHIQKKHEEIKQKMGQIPSLLNDNKKAMHALESAKQEFHKGVRSLDKETNAEQITVSITQGAAHVFSSLKELIHHSYETQRSVFYTTLHDLSDSVKLAISMEESTRLSNQVYEKLAVAFQNLNQLAQSVVNGKEVQQEVLDQIKAQGFEIKMARRGAWKNFVQKSRFEKILHTIQQAVHQMNSSVEQQKKVYSHTERMEKTSLRALSQILRLLLEKTLPNQREVNARLRNVNTALNQAQNANLRSKRRAA